MRKSIRELAFFTLGLCLSSPASAAGNESLKLFQAFWSRSKTATLPPCPATLRKLPTFIPFVDTAPQIVTDSKGVQHKFLRVYDESLGYGWLAPNLLIWFDPPGDLMTYDQAQKYAADIGGRLPTSRDFEDLALYMGAVRIPASDGLPDRINRRGYRPQLPFLKGLWLWTSSVSRELYDRREVFDGDVGSVDQMLPEAMTRVTPVWQGSEIVESRPTSE